MNETLTPEEIEREWKLRHPAMPIADPNPDAKQNDSDDISKRILEEFLAMPLFLSKSEEYAAKTAFGMNYQGDGARVGDTSAIDPGKFSNEYDLNKPEVQALFREFGGSTSHHVCAMAVREFLEAATGHALIGHPVNAGEYTEYLPTQGFNAVATGRGGRFNSLTPYQAVVGDVAVMKKPGEIGHIAVLGPDHIWHSDFAQTGASGMLGGPMFASGDATFTVFRHNSLMGVVAPQNASVLTNPDGAVPIVGGAVPVGTMNGTGSASALRAMGLNGAAIPDVSGAGDTTPRVNLTAATSAGLKPVDATHPKSAPQFAGLLPTAPSPTRVS